jgi:hypothetical protein
MSESNRPVRYRANEPSVIHQAIDGELVIIHLDHGLYYSLDSTGASIWQALVAGETASDIAATLARAHPAGDAEVATAVDALVERLRAEDLLVPIAEADTRGSAGDGFEWTVTGSPAEIANGSFQAPVLQRYEDLQDLLLLDPIHAVDESGWPDRRTDA